ncbi:MAG: hypothetical protein HC840_17480, partial [Leptolyngbyaceae cyanobacterium RM2_2_4]|nr:hypothetical protein [Leptolyngbyaceae cyanobacterium RM2_2_4]
IIDPGSIQPIADRLFQSQHPEGWFNEYGGPDFGYLTVTLDALADYYDVTCDERAIQAIDRAIAFLAQLVGADGRLPSTLNCRNTDYVVPYGLVRAASRNPLAGWLVETLFRDLGEPTHPIWATDDRYHCHYVFASIIRSLPHLDAMQAAQAPAFQPEIWLKGCGYWVYWSGDRQWTAYVAAHKGGLVRIHRQNQPPIVDHGWRIEAKGKLWTSNWWSDEWTIQRRGQEISIGCNCQKTQFHVATPVKHVILRLLAWLFGEKLVPFLKQKMIFRSGKADGPQFARRVRINATGVELQDQIEKWEGAIATTSPRQNLRHVASADSFSPEEWQPALLPPTHQSLDRKLQVSASWPSGSNS